NDMTTPQFPDEPNYWLRRLFETVDSIDKKLDVHAEKLASQEVRISALETETAALRVVAEGVGTREAAVASLEGRVHNLEVAESERTALRRANLTFAVSTLIALAGVIVALIA